MHSKPILKPYKLQEKTYTSMGKQGGEDIWDNYLFKALNNLQKFVFAKFKKSWAVSVYLNVGNSDSAEVSAASCPGSEFRRFCGYDERGCVWGGVKTGAFSDLWENTAPICCRIQETIGFKGVNTKWWM